MGAINFFAINGAGSGGGGTTTVHTDNGITGDGSIATPVKLGGKPLTGATVIDLNGFELDMIDVSMIFQISNIFKRFAYSNPGITHTNEVQDVSSFQHVVTDDVTNDTSSINQADPRSILLQILDGASGNVKELILSDAANTGIEINDTKDDIGLIGAVLFPASAGPNQYAQYGNVLTNADNGLTVNSGVVELGGALVVNPTVIDGTGVLFEVHAIGTGLQKTGLQLVNDNDIKLFANSAVLNNSANINVNCGGGAGHPFVTLVVLKAALQKAITIQDSITGIAITDTINNVGLIGDVLFPLSGDPKQYVQAGNLPGVAAVQKVLNQSTPSLFPLLVAAPANVLVRVNANVILTTFFAGDTINCSIDYTDINGNARNVALGVVNSLVPSAFPAVVLDQANGQAINFNVNSAISGASRYNAYGTVDILGTI